LPSPIFKAKTDFVLKSSAPAPKPTVSGIIMKSIPIAFLVIVAVFSPARAQNLILNGSFESPVVPDTSVLGVGLVPGSETFVDAGAPNNGITDWSVTQGTVSLINNGPTVVSTLGILTPPDGNQFAVLNSLSISTLGVITAGGLGTLQQTFATTAGNAYQLSFDYAGLGVAAMNGTAALQVTVSNSRNSTAPNSGNNINVAANNFQNETFDFVATSTSSTLTFDEPAGSLSHANGVGLDDVNVTNLGMVAVPEFPRYATVAAAFLGVLIFGRLLRRPAEASLPSGAL
jgi:hypothetical protein